MFVQESSNFAVSRRLRNEAFGWGILEPCIALKVYDETLQSLFQTTAVSICRTWNRGLAYLSDTYSSQKVRLRHTPSAKERLK